MGRLARQVRGVINGESPVVFGVLHSYRPEAIAALLSIGLGAAGAASGAAMARRADGSPVSAVSEAINLLSTWAKQEQRGLIRLPPRVCVIALPDCFQVFEWTAAQGVGRHVATWLRADIHTTMFRASGERGVRVSIADDKAAVLSTKTGLWHRRSRRVLSDLATDS